MWNPFRKKEPEVKVTDMNSVEKEVIRRLADGNESARTAAIEIYRRYILHLGSYNSTPEMNFMSEVDTPCPDLRLRAMYRERVLDKS